MSKQVHFLPFASLPEVPRGNGIVNYLIATRKVSARAMHTGISKLPVGVMAPRHSHNAEEQAFISAGVEHELVNVRDETAYVLAVYGSPDVDRTFAATGQTVAIGSDGDRFEP
jgi:hypothetical protein